MGRLTELGMGHDVRVVAHRAVAARFDRYRKTASWNTHVNARQFRMPGLAWPTGSSSQAPVATVVPDDASERLLRAGGSR